MNDLDYVKSALKDDGQIKLILKGETTIENNEKIAVVSVVFITMNVALIKEKFEFLTKNKKNDEYYMVYSCPLNTDLNKLPHFPSLGVTGNDLN